MVSGVVGSDGNVSYSDVGNPNGLDYRSDVRGSDGGQSIDSPLNQLQTIRH